MSEMTGDPGPLLHQDPFLHSEAEGMSELIEDRGQLPAARGLLCKTLTTQPPASSCVQIYQEGLQGRPEQQKSIPHTRRTENVGLIYQTVIFLSFDWP